MNKIAFFGASVTQQKNGYCKFFTDLNPNLKVAVFGYGGMNLADAGICYIDKVLEFQPDYCFIDWFGTAFIKEENFEEIKEYLNTIIYKFFSKNVKLIFLTLPNAVVNRNEIHKKINRYLFELKIPIIDLSDSFDNLDIILRDGAHTTDYGSEQYAKVIKKKFLEEILGICKIPENYSKKNKYCDIKKLDLNVDVHKKISFTGNCEVVGILQTVGPYTGLLKINRELFNNWDKWCYYEREMVNLKFNVKNSASIEVLQDDFDRSACKHICDWNVKKCLKLKTAYFVGESLRLKMENVKLSIITPVLNRENCIKQCIENFISQNCNEAEHIIIDGGSSDKTVEIIKEYAKKYPHIKWISEKDTGQSNAMNKGIKMAKGEIISFLNSDDFYEPGVFNKVLEIFEEIPKNSFVFGNCNVWKKLGNGAPILQYTWRPETLDYVTMVERFGETVFPLNPSAYFYHKKLHQKVGLYSEKLHFMLDTDFIYRVFPFANVKYINETFGNFLLTENAKTFENNKGKRIWSKYEDDYHNSMKAKLVKNFTFFIKFKIWKKRFLQKAWEIKEMILGKIGIFLKKYFPPVYCLVKKIKHEDCNINLR